MKNRYFLALFSLIFLFNSCEDETECCGTPEEEAQYQTGIFVLNEGNFGSGNSSVTYINEEDNNLQSQIFKSINGTDLGDTAQSIAWTDELAIIVVNVSNKLEIVNRFSFERLGSIDSQLENPRYAVLVDDKIYVTNWGDGMDPDDDFVAVFNRADFSYIESIPVAEGPEKLLAGNGKIYVAHKGGFSFNNIISVIDAGTSQIEAEIEVGDLPNSMVLDGNRLWVLASGKPSYSGAETPGTLSEINTGTNELVNEYTFPDVSMHPAHLNLIDSDVYFSMGKSLYTYNLAEMRVEARFDFQEPSLLYGVEIRDSRIFIASPNADFTGDGKLYIYDLGTGGLLEQYSVGINPNGIYFNE